MNQHRVLTFLVATVVVMLVLNYRQAHSMPDPVRRPDHSCNYPYKPISNDEEDSVCVCEDEYPVSRFLQDGNSVCCTNDLKECKCEASLSYHQPTNKCYEINMADYTIEVLEKKNICQNKTLVPQKGRGCCIINANGHKHCKCEDKSHVWISPFFDVCAPPDIK